MASIAMGAAVSGAQAQQLRIDTISNNVANVNTNGYKRVDVSTADLFYTTLKRAGILENVDAAPRPVGVQIGMGTKVTGTYRNLQQGQFNNTRRPLDIALTGVGYFAIALPNGRIGYTRAGAFHRDSTTGNMVDVNGNEFATNISIGDHNPQNVQISTDGLVSVQNPNSAQNTDIGRLEIFTFPNDSGLEAIGGNLLIATSGSGEAVPVEETSGRFKQKSLENSNVSAVEELTKLIEAQRAYELNTRVISTQDKILETTNNIK